MLARHAFLTLSLACLPVAGSAEDGAALLDRLSAGTIVAISDGDFVGQTYASGRLAPREAGHRDLLTVLSRRDGRRVTGTLPLSNSVTAAPEILDVARDGRTAFVVERLGERPEQGDAVRDLPPGRSLFAVDLADKARPRLSDTVRIDAFPEALSLSPDGRRIAVVSNTPEASVLTLVPVENGRFGPASRFDLARLGIVGDGPGPRGGVTATNVQWHPSGAALALNINTRNRVAFLRLGETDGRPSLRLWGEPAVVGTDPFVGRFSPDGLFYLTSNWGRDFAASDLAGRLPERPSTISVIRLGAAGDDARHQVVGQVATDHSAEGIAISPDGKLVATINMRGTAFPPGTPRHQRLASVTLLRFDPGSGSIEKVADYPLEGVLPEGGAFDATGDHLLATVFHGHEGVGPEGGPGLQVFRVVRGGQPRLESLGRIPLPHGVHHVVVAP